MSIVTESVADSVSHLLPTDGELRKIAAVAARTGLTARTIRYYEQLGLLAPPARTVGSFRLYTEADVARLLQIKRLKETLGFSLAVLKEMLEVEDRRHDLRAAYSQIDDPSGRAELLEQAIDLAIRRQAIVRQRIAELQNLEQQEDETLARLHAALGDVREKESI